MQYAVKFITHLHREPKGGIGGALPTRQLLSTTWNLGRTDANMNIEGSSTVRRIPYT